jgi:hypothetical protein
MTGRRVMSMPPYEMTRTIAVAFCKAALPATGNQTTDHQSFELYWRPRQRTWIT